MGLSRHGRKNPLPGKAWRVVSFIPGINYIALALIGIRGGNAVNFVYAFLYAIVTFGVAWLSPVMWLVGAVHYDFAYKQEARRLNELSNGFIAKNESYLSSAQKQQSIYDVTISGTTEKRQPIPPRSTPSIGYNPSNTSDNKFFSDMVKYADKTANKVDFIPFMTYWPTYDSMTSAQQSWYFYWRSQVRKNNYPDTDLSYIFVYIYEILSGIGWNAPEHGLNLLINIWTEYRERFPKLCNYMLSWTFDFAFVSNMDYSIPFDDDALRFNASPRTDMLISRYAGNVPLKLPFTLISALCDYSLTGSKFYKDNNQALIREAIPRIVALADASLNKKTQKGIISTYGPSKSKSSDYYLFQSAVCPNANKKISFTVKPYSSYPQLRGYVNELVRYGENVLREMSGYRGRLRGITLDDETAQLVNSFLKKEYAQTVQKVAAVDKARITLDFERISDIRKESDVVREALMVNDESILTGKSILSEMSMKPLLTDLRAVTDLYAAVSPEARYFLNSIGQSDWECPVTKDNELFVTEINHAAEYYLKSHLLIIEDSAIIAEDDYRDELEHIFLNPPEIAETDKTGIMFDVSSLNEHLKKFIENLMPEQQKTLYTLLVYENPQEELEQIAEESMTVPQLLLDEINEAAVNALGMILVDSMDEEHHISEEYASLLKQSVV